VPCDSEAAGPSSAASTASPPPVPSRPRIETPAPPLHNTEPSVATSSTHSTDAPPPPPPQSLPSTQPPVDAHPLSLLSHESCHKQQAPPPAPCPPPPPPPPPLLLPPPPPPPQQQQQQQQQQNQQAHEAYADLREREHALRAALLARRADTKRGTQQHHGVPAGSPSSAVSGLASALPAQPPSHATNDGASMAAVPTTALAVTSAASSFDGPPVPNRSAVAKMAATAAPARQEGPPSMERVNFTITKSPPADPATSPSGAAAISAPAPLQSSSVRPVTVAPAAAGQKRAVSPSLVPRVHSPRRRLHAEHSRSSSRSHSRAHSHLRASPSASGSHRRASAALLPRRHSRSRSNSRSKSRRHTPLRRYSHSRSRSRSRSHSCNRTGGERHAVRVSSRERTARLRDQSPNVRSRSSCSRSHSQPRVKAINARPSPAQATAFTPAIPPQAAASAPTPTATTSPVSPSHNAVVAPLAAAATLPPAPTWADSVKDLASAEASTTTPAGPHPTTTSASSSAHPAIILMGAIPPSGSIAPFPGAASKSASLVSPSAALAAAPASSATAAPSAAQPGRVDTRSPSRTHPTPIVFSVQSALDMAATSIHAVSASAPPATRGQTSPPAPPVQPLPLCATPKQGSALTTQQPSTTASQPPSPPHSPHTPPPPRSSRAHTPLPPPLLSPTPLPSPPSDLTSGCGGDGRTPDSFPFAALLTLSANSDVVASPPLLDLSPKSTPPMPMHAPDTNPAATAAAALPALLPLPQRAPLSLPPPPPIGTAPFAASPFLDRVLVRTPDLPGTSAPPPAAASQAITTATTSSTANAVLSAVPIPADRKPAEHPRPEPGLVARLAPEPLPARPRSSTPHRSHDAQCSIPPQPPNPCHGVPSDIESPAASPLPRDRAQPRQHQQHRPQSRQALGNAANSCVPTIAASKASTSGGGSVRGAAVPTRSTPPASHRSASDAVTTADEQGRVRGGVIHGKPAVTRVPAVAAPRSRCSPFPQLQVQPRPLPRTLASQPAPAVSSAPAAAVSSVSTSTGFQSAQQSQGCTVPPPPTGMFGSRKSPPPQPQATAAQATSLLPSQASEVVQATCGGIFRGSGSLARGAPVQL